MAEKSITWCDIDVVTAEYKVDNMYRFEILAYDSNKQWLIDLIGIERILSKRRTSIVVATYKKLYRIRTVKYE